MKKNTALCICTLLCMFLTGCAGPGTGPGGVYTAADHQRDQTNTVLAVGAATVGAAVLGTALYNAGRHDATPHYRYYRYPAPAPRLRR